MQDAGKIFEMAMELSREQQIDLAERILASAHGPADPSVEAAWDAEIKRRIEAIENGTAKTIPWEDVRRELDDWRKSIR